MLPRIQSLPHGGFLVGLMFLGKMWTLKTGDYSHVWMFQRPGDPNWEPLHSQKTGCHMYGPGTPSEMQHQGLTATPMDAVQEFKFQLLRTRYNLATASLIHL